MSDKVKFIYTKDELHNDFINKLKSFETNAQAANKPALNLGSAGQAIREKLMGSLGMKSK